MAKVQLPITEGPCFIDIAETLIDDHFSDHDRPTVKFWTGNGTSTPKLWEIYIQGLNRQNGSLSNWEFQGLAREGGGDWIPVEGLYDKNHKGHLTLNG